MSITVILIGAFSIFFPFAQPNGLVSREDSWARVIGWVMHIVAELLRVIKKCSKYIDGILKISTSKFIVSSLNLSYSPADASECMRVVSACVWLMRHANNSRSERNMEIIRFLFWATLTTMDLRRILHTHHRHHHHCAVHCGSKTSQTYGVNERTHSEDNWTVSPTHDAPIKNEKLFRERKEIWIWIMAACCEVVDRWMV